MKPVEWYSDQEVAIDYQQFVIMGFGKVYRQGAQVLYHFVPLIRSQLGQVLRGGSFSYSLLLQSLLVRSWMQLSWRFFYR